MDFLFMLATFIVVIGVLVFIHEAGHFLVAKFFKVTVETFSLGFGPRLIGFTRSGTDYRISAIPLGGYVKMAGENPDEIEASKDVEGALIAKPAWQRFLIFIAGPLANILLAVVIPTAVFMVSYQVPAYKDQPARVDFVAMGSPADKAGVKKGDLVTSFDGIQSPTWEQVEDITFLKPGQKIPLQVERDGQRLDLVIELQTRIQSGEKMGLSGMLPDWPGDGVVIGSVEPGSPAEQAGLQPGDKIIKLEGTPIRHIYELQAVVGANVGRPLRFTVVRQDSTFDKVITPFFDEARNVGRIGFAQNESYIPPMVHKQLGMGAALSAALDYNRRNLWMMKQAVGAVLSGHRAVGDTFAGPVQIASISGKVAQQGFEPLLMLMAMLSLSLGLFNLLPIPILDGGQVVMLFVEKSFSLFGREFTVALREKIQTVGFVLIVLFMGFIIYSDIARLVQ